MLKHVMIAALVLGVTSVATAELQNVCVGGELRIRGNWYSASAVGDVTRNRNEQVQPWWYNGNVVNVAAPINGARIIGPLAGANPLAGFRSPGLPFFGAGLPFRPLGFFPALGQTAGFVTSAFGWDEDNNSLSFIEQRTKLNVKADFTNDVSVFIELDSYDVWGEDFRSNYITGADFRAASGNDVEIYQAYVEANEMYGYPVRLRIGRQEMSLGSEWLLGVNDASSFFTGLSFDGIRATYATDMFSVDAFWAKLAERSPAEQDGDVDLWGVYGSYTGIEDISIDAYYLLVRDGIKLNDTQFGLFGEAIEDFVDVDDYDSTMLHTVGLRGAGVYGAFDFEAEVAYQFGSADTTGFGFFRTIYGDDEADFGNLGANLELGYTFDMTYTPRIYIGGAYFGGEDNREISFGEWLWAQVNPFYQGEASVSFNRLFSNWEYTEFFANSDESNMWLIRGGVSVNPTEQVEVLLAATWFNALENFSDTYPDYRLFGNRVTWLSPLSWIDEEHDDNLGIEVGLYVTYAYSEDLEFSAGWAHLFTDDGLTDGNFVVNNGLGYTGGTDDDDADYVYLETKIKF